MNVPKELGQRLLSLDTYRGFVMFLMAAEVLHWGRLAREFPDNLLLKFLHFNSSHVDWYWASLHDMIQPSFSFIVGVAVPYSIANRLAKGQKFQNMLAHTVWRSIALVLLGVFLRSMGKSMTNWTFEDTLSQIGLGYTFLFLLGLRSMRFQWIALGCILFGYWLAFVLYPLPAAGFDYAAVGVPADWSYHSQGIAAHFNKNSNFAWAFDKWFLNLFPRPKLWIYNGGGYSTLSFIPTLGTMVLGLIAGGWLRSSLSNAEKIRKLIIAGGSCLALGILAHACGICPVVKKIWTPSWTLFSGGICFLFLAGFYAVVDVKGCHKIAFPLIVIGMNSIAIYCMAHSIDGFVVESFRVHFGRDVFKILGATYESLLSGATILTVFWLILFWMNRRKIFIRI